MCVCEYGCGCVKSVSVSVLLCVRMFVEWSEEWVQRKKRM